MRYEYVNYNKYNIDNIYDVFEKEERKDFFRICKALKFTVNSYPGKHRYAEKVERLNSWLQERLTTGEKRVWEKILKESDCLNMLYKDLYADPNYLEANSIEPQQELAAFLICTEYILSAILELMCGDSNLAKLFDNVAFEVEGEIEDGNDRLRFYGELYDNISVKIKDVLEFIMYYKKSDIVCEKVSKENVRKSCGHLEAIMKKNWLDLILEGWQFGDLDIVREDNTIICENDFWGKIMRTYWEMIERSITTTEMLALAEFPNGADKEMLEVERASFVLKKQLYVDDLDCEGQISHNGKNISVHIMDWVRCFARLKTICEHHLQKRNIKEISGDISQICVKIKRADVEKQLSQLRIKDVPHILELLTYRKDRDIIDAPLIPDEENFYMIPSLVASTNISQTVLSMVNVFQFRGKQLEEQVLSLLKEEEIVCGSLKKHEDSDTYQCDSIFVVEKTLFLVEAKAWGLSNSITQYYHMNAKIMEAGKQIERLHEYILNNMPMVLHELGLSQDYKINNVYSILVSNFQKADEQDLENIFMCDFNSFRGVIKGIPSGTLAIKREGEGFNIYGEKRRTTKITAKELVEFLGKRESLKHVRALLEEKMYCASINKLFVEKKELQRKIGLVIVDDAI